LIQKRTKCSTSGRAVPLMLLLLVSLASSGTLAVMMGMRAYKSRKFMPAGMTAALRCATFTFLENC